MTIAAIMLALLALALWGRRPVVDRSALERASEGDLDADTIEQFIATSAVIRRSIVDLGSPTFTHIQSAVTDENGQTHNQKEEVQI